MSMAFQEFEISVLCGTDETCKVRVTSSRFGTSKFENTKLPDPVWLPRREGDHQYRETEADGASDPSCEDLGMLLGKAIFKGQVARLFEQAIGKGDPLRIRLELNSEAEGEAFRKLHQLPWEALHDSQGNALFLKHTFSVVRKAVMAGETAPTIRRKLKVLILKGAPTDHSPLALDREQESMTEALEKFGARVTALPVEDGGPLDRRTFYKALMAGQHILHFMGHGNLNTLLFTDEWGNARPIQSHELRTDLLGLPKGKRPVLAFFNACSSGAMEVSKDHISSVARTLHETGIPAVIGMREKISDDAAILFSETVYQQIAKGISVDEAITQGRLAIHQTPGIRGDWHIPVFYTSLMDTRIFRPIPLRRMVAWGTAVIVLIALILAYAIFKSPVLTVSLQPPTFNGKSMAHATAWKDTLVLQTRLSEEGIRTVHHHLGSPKWKYRIDLEVVSEALGMTILGKIFDKEGKQTFQPVWVSGPANPELKDISLIKWRLANKLLQTLLDKVEPIPANSRAMEAYHKGLEFFPNNLIEAGLAFEEALKEAKEFSPARNNLAMVKAKLGQFEIALDLMEQIVATHPEMVIFQYNLGLVLKAFGRPDRAREVFRKAISLDPYHPMAHIELGKLALDRSAEEKVALSQALNHFEKVLRSLPGNPTAYKYISRVYLKMGDGEMALSYLEKALAGFRAEEAADLQTQIAEVRFLQAQALHLSGRDEEACAIWSKLDSAMIWRYSEEVSALESDLNCQQSEKNHALVIGVQPTIFVSQKNRFLVPGNMIHENESFDIPENGSLEIICGHYFHSKILGPSSWPPADHQLLHGRPVEPWVVEMLTSSEFFHSGVGLEKKSFQFRSDDDIPILSPRQKVHVARPELVWATTKDTHRDFVLKLDVGHWSKSLNVPVANLTKIEMSIGRKAYRLFSMAWPDNWPSLDWGEKMTLSVRTGTGLEGRTVFQRLDANAASLLQTKLEKIDGLEPEIRLLVARNTFIEFECFVPALLGILDKPTLVEASDLTLANLCFDLGIYSWALALYDVVLEETEVNRDRVICRIRIGQIYASQKRWQEARTNFLLAQTYLEPDSQLGHQIEKWLGEVSAYSP